MRDRTVEIPERMGEITRLEDVLCLTVLVATGKLSAMAKTEDANFYFRTTLLGECRNCPSTNKCMACIINE